MRFTTSAVTTLLLLTSAALPSFAAPLPTHVSSLVPHPDSLSPRSLSLRSVISLLVPRSTGELEEIEAREPCLRGVSRPSAPQLSPRTGGDGYGRPKKRVKVKGRRRPKNRPGIDYGSSRLNDGKYSIWSETPNIVTQTKEEKIKSV